MSQSFFRPPPPILREGGAFPSDPPLPPHFHFDRLGYVTVTINYRGESEQIKLNKLNAVFRSAEFIRECNNCRWDSKDGEDLSSSQKPKRLPMRTIIITTIEPTSQP
ncbi:hypothetical protein CDAR_485471 [Caerostris darwini]|uniref:Uncharacterized protein n=1 Tax=Caerostris darwini TaxID=1538125 RepID=A0AAV4PA35_9ARAC|nr:hypothetical protein CDAR_485471 [Caerostris darwini]